MLLFLFLFFLLPPFLSHLFSQFSHCLYPSLILNFLLSFSFLSHILRFSFCCISFSSFFQPHSFLLSFIFFATFPFSSSHCISITFLCAFCNFLFSSIVSFLSLQGKILTKFQQLQDFNIIIPTLKCMFLVILTMALSAQFLENYQSR